MSKEKSFYDEVREAVHYQWDPIGVAAYSDEMGEYDGYILNICEFLNGDVDEKEIFNYLWCIETESIGMTGDFNRTSQFASWLYGLKMARKKAPN